MREVATFYVEIVRGIPVLVLLFYVAFVGAPALVVAWNWLTALADRAGACCRRSPYAAST